MTTLVELDRTGFRDRREDILDVYAEAMQVERRGAASRRSILASHEKRAGLLVLTALDGDAMVGVAYGYLGEPGQWWHDQVSRAMTAGQRTDWLLGAFEVCELHVRPALHGTGLGRRLLDELLQEAAGRTEARTAVLTTPDAETRARRFYRIGGWHDLVRQLVFPGDAREFAVLGRELTRSVADVTSG